MNADEFIEYIKNYIRDDSIEDTISYISVPPGRKPHQRIKDLSQWYNSLDTFNKNNIKEMIIEAVDSSLSGFLCAIDGVRAIDNEEPKGQLKLIYVNGKAEILLNNEDDEFLHDKYNLLVQDKNNENI